MKKYLLAILITLFSIGCASMNSKEAKANLDDGEYKIISVVINNETLEIPQNVSFNIKDSRVYGNAGCNNYFSSLIKNDNSVMFDHAGSTRMLCHEKVINEFELKYLRNLNGEFHITTDNGNIVLKNQEAKITIKKK